MGTQPWPAPAATASAPPPLRPGERVTHIRFWMARDTYQDVSPAQSLIAVSSGGTT